MVKSLRSLCLLKVSSERINYEDLPTGLVKDLNKMKVFNGNYSFESESNDDDLHLTALTILYDGVSWTFTSRSDTFEIYCCYYCNVYQPALHQLTVTEGELVTACSPFSQVRDWLRLLEHKDKMHQQQHLYMKMTVKVGEDGMFGEIAFHGGMQCCEVLFNSIMEVDFTMEGTRILSHFGYTDSGLETRDFSIYESRVSAEDAFMQYISTYDEDWSEKEDEEFGLESDGDVETAELEVDGLKEFWIMIENISP